MLLSICSITSYAYDFEANGLYYAFLNSTSVEVSQGDNSYNFEGQIVEIPSQVSFGSRIYEVTKIGDKAFQYANLKGLTIPSSITLLGEYSLYGSSIEELTIPGTVATCKYGSFYNCSNLKSVKFEYNEKSLQLYYYPEHTAFSGCNKLETVFVDRQVYQSSNGSNWSYKDEYHGIFYGLNIKNIIFGNNVKSISSKMFSHCSKIESVDIPSNIESIAYYAFLSCSNLQNINFQECNSLSLSSSCFENCVSLKTLNFKEGLKKIDNSAFSGCDSITTIYFPTSLNIIGSYAFDGSKKISKIICNNPTPPQIYQSSFSGSTYVLSTLYVPNESKSMYENSEGWKEFASIVESDTQQDPDLPVLSLSVSAGGKVYCDGIEISNFNYAKSVEAGSSVVLEIVPDEGYVLKSIVVNSNDVTEHVIDGKICIDNIDLDVKIYITFEKDLPTLSLRSSDYGTIQQYVELGKSYTFVIIPSEGWNIESVSFNGEDVTSQLDGNKYTTPVISSDSELNIVYKQDVPGAVKVLRSENKLRVFAGFGKLTIENAGANVNLSVYTTSGTKVAYESVVTGTTTIDLPTNNIYIIKAGEDTFKVSM